MSRDYILICFDCKKYLSFGKVHCFDGNDVCLEDWTFQGVFNGRELKWHKRDEFFGKVIEKFFLTHRNHELRFVPEGIDEMLELKHDCCVDCVEENELLETKIHLDVDWWKEKENWMRSFSHDSYLG